VGEGAPGVGTVGRTTGYFGELHARILEAGRRRGFVDRWYAIGGRSVRLRFVGGALVAPLTRALAHLASDSAADPELTACIAAGGEVELPLPPWELPGSGPLVGPEADTRRAVHLRDERIEGLLEVDHGAISLFDRASSVGLFWVASPERLAYFERGAPLRAIFHWWGLRHGWHMAHAGAVGTDRGGVLLVGKGGSGKSTSALACLGAGLDYLGDNDVVIEAEPAPFAHGLYCSAKLEAGHLRRALPHLAPLLATAGPWNGGKGLFYVDGEAGHRLARGFPLRAVLLPRVTGAARAVVTRVSSGQGLLALAPSTLFQLPGSRQERLSHLARVVARIPTYTLELGPNVDTIAPAIRALLADAPA
jgi:hypothetical protein